MRDALVLISLDTAEFSSAARGGIQHCIVLYVLYFIFSVLYNNVLHCTILYFTLFYLLFYSSLYFIIIYITVLINTALYCTTKMNCTLV